MTTQERLAGYKSDMELLQRQKAALRDKIRDLQEELENLEEIIHEKQVEIDECEAYLLNPEYPEN